MIYLDYQATTPLAPEVRTAMLPWFDKFANPHSPNRWGREAAAVIDFAREQVENLIAPADGKGGGTTLFTGGATEALNLAIKGLCGERRHLVVIASEHAAVLDPAEWLMTRGWDVTVLAVGRDGRVVLADVEKAVSERTALVAAMLVNNEIGVIQPITEIAAIAHRVGARMLCDAVQGFGRMEIPPGPDMVAASAHKVHGPVGIGALWVRGGVKLEPLLHGGGQERGLRSGTLSPMLCAGFGAAATLAGERREADMAHVERLWSAALDTLGPGWSVNGNGDHRYRGNLNLSREGLDGARLLADCRQIAFSLGSACASGSGRPSHVLRAIGLSDRETRGSIRLGFGRYTSESELVEACRMIRASAEAQRVGAG